MSLEQSTPFHTVRRLLRSLDPEWRIMSNPTLGPRESAIDHLKKTLEVGESTPVMEGVAILLFSIGHIRLRKKKEFNLYFGNGIRKWRWSEEKLISNLVEQALKADELASEWAKDMYSLFWPIDPSVAKETMDKLVWTKKEWVEYFSS